MKKGQNKNNGGVKVSVTSILENTLSNSVEQPDFELNQPTEETTETTGTKPTEGVTLTEQIISQLHKFGIGLDFKVNDIVTKLTFDTLKNDYDKAKHIKAIESARDKKNTPTVKIIQYNQSWLETFNREFIVSQIERDGGIGFFERYYSNTLSKDELNSISYKMFKNNAVVRIECSIIATKLKSETCYVRLEEGFIHLFTNKRETRLPYKRINLVKYKTFEYFLLNYKLQVDNSDLIYKRSELAKFQKELASNLATKIITSGTEGIYVTQTKFANKVVSSIKKKQKEANVITENPTEVQVIQA